MDVGQAIRRWLLIPAAFVAGILLAPRSPLEVAPPNNPPSPPMPVMSAESRPPVGLSRAASLNDVDPAKRLFTLLKVYAQDTTRSTLATEAERFRLLAEVDVSTASRLLSDLWNLESDPARNRIQRDQGVMKDAFIFGAAAVVERHLVERLFDLDRSAAWDLSVLRSRPRALAACLKELRRSLQPPELLQKLIALPPELARFAHREYLKEPEMDGSATPPLFPPPSLPSLLSVETLRWFKGSPLIFLEEILASSLTVHARVDAANTADLLTQILEHIRESNFDPDAWESLGHDLIRILHRALETEPTSGVETFFSTLRKNGSRALVEAYQGPSDETDPPSKGSPMADGLRISGRGAFQSLMQPHSPLADDPIALAEWFERLPDGPFREGFLDAALEDATARCLTQVAGPERFGIGSPEERIAFLVDWFDRQLRAGRDALTVRESLSKLPLRADEQAAIFHHISPLRLP